MWFMHEGSGWWMLFGGIWMVFFWGGIIALIVWGITRLTRSDGRQHHRHDALDIAEERYASGEITREEYQRIRKDVLLHR